MTQFGIGQPVRRVEDRRFLTGRGHYLDDIVRPRQTYAVMLRSPHAHARIRALDAQAAAGPGVLAVLTGAELAQDGIGTIPCLSGVANTAAPPRPAIPAIVGGRVRHVGDTVAIVVAESLAAARDAAERVAVDYEPLPAVVDTAQALEPGRAGGVARGSDRHPGNLCFEWEVGDRAAVERALAAARHQCLSSLVNNRVVATLDGAARRDRRIRPGRRQLYAVEFDPGVAFRAQPVGRACLSYAGKPHPDGDAGCRRRVRHEALSLSRARAGAVGGEEARPAGQMGPRPLGFVHDRHARPRQPDPARSGARRASCAFSASRSRSPPIWAPICRISRPRSRPSPARSCTAGSMRSRRSMSRSRASSPTPCRSTPIAAPGGRRPPMRVERLIEVAARRLGVAPLTNCAGATSSSPRRCRTRPRSASLMTAAISPATWMTRWRPPMLPALPRGARRRGRAGVTAGSATRSISSNPAFRPTSSPNCASIRRAR